MKRLIDLVLASLGLVLFAPIIIVVAILVMVTLGNPIIFKQLRPGLNCIPFHIYKFRTMTNEQDNNGQYLSDAHRLTSFGRFLRSTSMDELPALWNVLIGQMSLVGPRPLLMEYLPLYSQEQNRRHSVKPGITGWAQINGRNAISWEEKFEHDIWYIDNQSTWLDIKILFLTLKKVFIRNGINAENSATMPKFTGKNQQQ